MLKIQKFSTLTAVALVASSLLAPMAMAGDRPSELAPLGDPPNPASNPTTPEKVELGKLLFFDGRMSANGFMGCVVCHLPDEGWDFPDKISMGYPGTVHWRNSQTIINSAYYDKLFWAGSSSSLEGQARSAARGGVAGNGEDDGLEARLAFVPEYVKRFNEVFGDTWPNVRNAYRAIAAFERTLVQTDTPFDNYMRGDDGALNKAEKAGLDLFVGKANCASCHSGALLTNQKYYNTGVPTYDGWQTDALAQITYRFEIFAKGVSEDKYRTYKEDPGLYFRTKEEADLGKFRVPSLRYTKYTAPYMHNGMIETLEDVIEFYNKGGSTNDFSASKTDMIAPLDLSKKEKANLLAFLNSLSGERITMDYPDLPPTEPLPAPVN
ncbi:MAG: cytochrome-c peroxidase [Devosiaceae bacterium]|nr:cytochrome-c peroxidase [Devosiaceae bacterium]